MSLTDPRYYMDNAHTERQVLNSLRVSAAAERALDEIARRAGVQGGGTRREQAERALGERMPRRFRVEVFFIDTDETPPTLQWVKKGKVIKKTGASQRQTHKKRERRVVVGRGWLREHAPELWAAFMAARLHGQSGLIPTLITETEQ